MINQNSFQRLSRRDLLRCGLRTIATTGAASALGVFGRMNALAQVTTDYRALVCVFLMGGNDANNTVVPMASASYTAYQTARRSLAIPQSLLLPFSSSAGSFGLHPSLASILPLYTGARKLAVVANVGTLVGPITKTQYQARSSQIPTNLFSHADQQEQWQSASPMVRSLSGWSGRIADRMQGVNDTLGLPMGIGVSTNTLQLIGQSTQPAILHGSLALQGSDNSPWANARDASMQEMLTLSSGAALVQGANKVMSDALGVAKLVDTATNAAGPLVTVFPATSLGGQMQQIAQLIKIRSALGARRQIFFCSLDGFDTHSYQGSTHASLLKTLADSLLAFYNALGELGVQNQVTTFTESEFGRTLQVNSSLGTDHAWGGHQFVFGGAVRGGEMYGQFPTLQVNGPDDCSTRGCWLPTLSLDQYGATLAKWFGVSSTDLGSVFPNLVNFPSGSLAFL